LSKRLSGKRFGQTEVQNLDLSLRCHFDVGRLQVTVDDAFLVSRFEGFCDLLEEKQCLIDTYSPTTDLLRQSLAIHEFQDQEVHAVRLFEVEECGDVGMIQ
jgi:hypothetical protein